MNYHVFNLHPARSDELQLRAGATELDDYLF